MTIRLENQINTKILLLGLDNTGKSSILLSLKENTNLLSYLSLKPTKGMNIESFKTEEYSITCWDLSGQKIYREEFLKHFNNYSVEVDQIIFVIDIQDIDRYDLALEFLRNVIAELKMTNKKIEFSIFLHKYDPNIKSLEKFKDIDEIVNLRLIKKINEIISPTFNYKIFKTTIYSVFEKLLVYE
jgi:GTPase SAR1 family protein